MKIHIVKRSGKFITDLELPDNATLNQLKETFYEKFHYYPERQRYSINSARGPLLLDGRLQDNKVFNETTLYFKDLGVQISWRLVFFLEYLGPLIIMPLLWYFPTLFYSEDISRIEPRSKAQVIAFVLFMFHFIKREIETLFVHRFSNATMPLIRLPINCGHYWFLCAFSIGYFLCHPRYHAPYNGSPIILYFFAILFLIFEMINFKTHHILRHLRPRGTKERGLPQGYGFDWVSCANYFWEVSSWIMFCLISMCFTSFLFTIIAFIQMLIWALKKHKTYIKEFRNYPKKRRAMIPFII